MPQTTLRKVFLSLGKNRPRTFGHSMRVAGYVEAIAFELGFSPAQAKRYARAALVHDVGKLFVPRAILDDHKTRGDSGATALSTKDFSEMKRHTGYGLKVLGMALSKGHPEYKMMRDAVLFHHERLDGKGYVHRQGRKIPFIARLIAVADVFDALTSDRVYRRPLRPRRALEIIKRDAGKAFDTRIMGAFSRVMVQRRYRRVVPQGALADLAQGL